MTTYGSQTLTWDVENRVTAVTGGASFVYDGDGSRSKKTEGGETILYINQYYEKNLTTGIVTTHYYLGSIEVAFKVGNDLRYPLDNHQLSFVDDTGLYFYNARYCDVNSGGSKEAEIAYTMDFM